MQRQDDFQPHLLPETISSEIAPKLDLVDIAQSLSVSCHWHNMFEDNHTWKTLIERDFGIPLQTLNVFESLAKPLNPVCPPNFKTIYKHLRYLAKSKDPESYFLDNYHLQLLACCSNRVDYAAHFLPKEEWYIWQEVMKAAECDALFPLFFSAVNLAHESHFYRAAKDNQLAFMKFLLAGGSTPSVTTVDTIFKNGSLSHVQLIIDHLTSNHLDSIELLFIGLLYNRNLNITYIAALLSKPPFQVVETLPPSQDLIYKLLHFPHKGVEEKIIHRRLLRTFLDLAKIHDLRFQFVTFFSRLFLAGFQDEAIYFFNTSKSFFRVDEALNHAVLDGNIEFLQRVINPSHKKIDLISRAIATDEFEIFLVLLNRPNGVQFTLTYSNLCSAAGAKTPAFLAHLLDPTNAYGILPDRDLLASAVIHGRQENVKLLLQPQFGLKLKEDMFTTSCADVAFFEFIFQLNSHPSIPQSLLDSQLINIGDDKAEMKRRWLVIKCLLDHCPHLTITQEQLENLFDRKHYYLWDKILNYTRLNLTVTSTTLKHAISDNRLDYVKRLIEKFKMTPTQKLLRRALYNIQDSLPIIEYLLKEQFHLSLNLDSFVGVFSIGPSHFEYMSFKLKKFIYFLQQKLTFDYTAVLSRLVACRGGYAFECIRLLLEPALQVRLDEINNGYVNERTIGESWANYILTSHIAILKALRFLNEGQASEAELEFTRAFEFSPRQCLRVARYALTHPAQYKLEEQSIDALNSMVQNAMGELHELTIIEQIELTPALSPRFLKHEA